jgi:hypothetical protein
MSKESIIKKNLERKARENPDPEAAAQPQKRSATRPVGSLRRPVRRFNKRFIITLAIWVAALIAAVYFLTQQ